MRPPTFAAGPRLRFAELPAAVIAWIGDVLGGEVADADDRVGGFSPGAASIVTTAGGRRAFVKAVGTSVNPHSISFHRAERSAMERLPALPSVVTPIAAGPLSVDGEDWEVMVLPAIGGTTPGHPWTRRDAVVVLDAVADLGERLTPSPWPADDGAIDDLRAFLTGWQRLAVDDGDPWLGHDWVARHLPALVVAEQELHRRLPGDTLSHCDLRADNVLIDGERVWFVDWAHARTTMRHLDPLLLLCDIVASGADVGDGGEVDVEALLASHVAVASADDGLVVGLVASVAATLHVLSALGAPPGLPTIRSYQAITAEALLRFLVRRHPDGPPEC